jgi:adenosine deaminase
MLHFNQGNIFHRLKCVLPLLILGLFIQPQSSFAAPSANPIGNLTQLPVSELHVHADGGILTQAIFETFARKNNLDINSGQFFQDGIIRHKSADFLDFLKVYDEVTSVIKTEDDLTLVVYDYLRRCAQDGAIYVELLISPDHFLKNRKDYDHEKNTKALLPSRPVGLSYQQTIDAVAKAIDKANKHHGIDSRINVVILRHNGPEQALRLINKVIKNPHPYVVGINLAGDDINFNAKKFSAVYKLARAHGLKLTAHMGEHTGPKDILLAMKMKLDRIGHGLAVVENQTVMNAFKKTHIGIEVCPSSNIGDGKGKYQSMANHPLKTMIDNDLFVAISTDDPAFLHTNIAKEYLKVQKSYQLDYDDMIKLCRNSIKMSFADKKLKKKLLLKIDINEAANKLSLHIKRNLADKKAMGFVASYRQNPNLKTLQQLKSHMINKHTKSDASQDIDKLMKMHLALLKR